MTWSTRAGSRQARCSAAVAAAVPRSAAERDASAPRNLPIGVRTGAARTMSWSLLIRSSSSNVHALHFRVRLERFAPELAAEAALLEAAERGGRVVPVVLVDPDRSRLQPARHVVGFAYVARPDPGGETVDRGIGQLDRLVHLGEGDHRQHRPEDLLPGHHHVVLHAVED